MNHHKTMGALLVASAVAGLLGHSLTAHAFCAGQVQTTFGLDSSCNDSQNNSGRSRGLFNPKRIQAFLFQGKRAQAVGLRADGATECSVFDLRANGEANPVTSSPCTTTTIKHQILVTGF